MKELMDEIYRNGLGMTSPATQSIQSAQNEIALTKSEIARLPVADENNPIGFDPEVIARANEAIDSVNGELVSVNDYVNEMNSNMFSVVTQASAASRIDEVPGDCGNINQVTGTVTGSSNYLFDMTRDISKSLAQSIADYFDGLIDQEAMTALLDALKSEFDTPINELKAIVSEEGQYYSAMIKRVQSSTLAQSVTTLFNDPCVQGVLDATLPDRIKDLI